MLSQHESSAWPESDRVTQSSSDLWIHVGKFHTIGEICAESVVLTTYGRNKSVCFWQNRPEKSQILATSICKKRSRRLPTFHGHCAALICNCSTAIPSAGHFWGWRCPFNFTILLPSLVLPELLSTHQATSPSRKQPWNPWRFVMAKSLKQLRSTAAE